MGGGNERGVEKLSYGAGAGVGEVSLKIATARFTVLSGQSGSGKTTLLNLIGGIDRADAGEIAVAGQDLGRLSDDALSDFRARISASSFRTST